MTILFLLPAVLFLAFSNGANDLVGVVMAIGGLLAARRVAITMSDRIIVRMNHAQGFTANLVTAFLVTVASHFGVPVSATHISCGSLCGLGSVTGEARWQLILGIILAWVLTLPVAAVLAALVAQVLG